VDRFSKFFHRPIPAKIMYVPPGLLQLCVGRRRRCSSSPPSVGTSPELVVTARSCRFSRQFTAFSPPASYLLDVVLAWKCLHHQAPRYLADLCVPTAFTTVDVSHVPQCLEPFWYRGLGPPLALAALLCLFREPVCRHHFDRRILHRAGSGVSSRLICSSTKKVPLTAVSCVIVWCRCDFQQVRRRLQNRD